jgi:hypothetical protein
MGLRRCLLQWETSGRFSAERPAAMLNLVISHTCVRNGSSPADLSAFHNRALGVMVRSEPMHELKSLSRMLFPVFLLPSTILASSGLPMNLNKMWEYPTEVRKIKSAFSSELFAYTIGSRVEKRPVFIWLQCRRTDVEVGTLLFQPPSALPLAYAVPLRPYAIQEP